MLPAFLIWDYLRSQCWIGNDWIINFCEKPTGTATNSNIFKEYEKTQILVQAEVVFAKSSHGRTVHTEETKALLDVPLNKNAPPISLEQNAVPLEQAPIPGDQVLGSGELRYSKHL